jgi:hypothetical protein
MPQSQWTPFGDSVVGASHIRRDKENQDWYYPHQGIESPDGQKIPSIIAVSDGHGGNKYIRSAVGSRAAATLAAKIAQENIQLSSEMRKDDIVDAIRHIKSRYLLFWQKAVDNAVKQAPFKEEELVFLKENCPQKHYDAVLNNPRLAYGCTFMCAIGYDDLVLILQLGDGDILGLYPNDDVRELMKSDLRNFANETLSLCSLSNITDIAHEVLVGDEIPQLITLSTDGVKNSYDDKTSDIDAFYNIPVAIKNELLRNNFNIDDVRSGMKKMLERITSNGAGDDVTIGVLFRELEIVNERGNKPELLTEKDTTFVEINNQQ